MNKPLWRQLPWLTNQHMGRYLETIYRLKFFGQYGT